MPSKKRRITMPSKKRIEELLFDVLEEVTWVIEAYADDWNTDSPTDVTALLPKLQNAVLTYQQEKR